MKIRYLCAKIAIALVTCLPIIAAEDAFQIFQMEAIPLPGPAVGTSLPPVQMVSVTIAAASSVTVNPCVGGTQGCPDPTPEYPSAVLPAGDDVVVTWMFQDISYTGPIQMTVGFIQNGVVVGQPSRSHSNPNIVAGKAYLVRFATVVPAQASPGPATVVVNLGYGGATTRASQEFAVSATPLLSSAAPDASAPAIQMVSVTVAAGSFVVNSCVGGTQGCPDPTPGYASIPFPSAVVPINGDAYITLMFLDQSYTGPISVTIAFVQNGAVVGQGYHLGNGLSIEPVT
jgi:hypothetical protein